MPIVTSLLIAQILREVEKNRTQKYKETNVLLKVINQVLK